MSSPVFHPAANPCDAVLEQEAKILEAEGHYHVNGIYFASQSDAATQRRWEAEKRVREASRQQPLTCAFCFDPIQGNVAVVIAQRSVHPACAKEFDAWVASTPASNDARWSAVTINTPVIFDGEMTTWGELAQNEKTECQFNKNGVLEGGYPI